MNENLFETQYDLTKKSKLRRYYESNKILIFSSVFILVVLFATFTFYSESKEKKRILMSENYIEAKINLSNGKKEEAKKILKEVIFANDSTYSTLGLFLILDQNLISDYKELSVLFDHLLENNKFEKEIKNLLIYKKALFDSNYIDESELLNDIKPLLNNETLWKPQALLLMGDYFVSKKDYIKAKEFYGQILLIKNLQKSFYNQAQSKIISITNY